MNKFKNSTIGYEWVGGLMMWMHKDFHIKNENGFYIKWDIDTKINVKDMIVNR